MYQEDACKVSSTYLQLLSLFVGTNVYTIQKPIHQANGAILMNASTILTLKKTFYIEPIAKLRQQAMLWIPYNLLSLSILIGNQILYKIQLDFCYFNDNIAYGEGEFDIQREQSCENKKEILLICGYLSSIPLEYTQFNLESKRILSLQVV